MQIVSHPRPHQLFFQRSNLTFYGRSIEYNFHSFVMKNADMMLKVYNDDMIDY